MALAEYYYGTRLLVWSARAARVLGLRRLVRAVRSRSTWGILNPLHHDVILKMRTFATLLEPWDRHPNPATPYASEFCTAARKVVGDLLELDEGELHCCLKGIVQHQGSFFVETWARSEPTDTRPDILGELDQHAVDDNTVWSALLGRTDGHTNWKPLRAFACPDLANHADRFSCSRKDWSHYYRSVLVYPLRYNADANRDYRTVGFLAFDSILPRAFDQLPDAFEFSNPSQWAEYHKRLSEVAVYHLGGLVAEALATVLRPVYEERAEEGFCT